MKNIIKPLDFTILESNTSKFVFNGRLIKLIYTIDVPSTASIWWTEYKKFDNVRLFPENILTLQQEIQYISRLLEKNIDEPLLIITKSPFILQEFPNNLVHFAKLDESSVTRFLPNEERTYHRSIESIMNCIGRVITQPMVESV